MLNNCRGSARYSSPDPAFYAGGIRTIYNRMPAAVKLPIHKKGYGSVKGSSQFMGTP